MDVNENKEVVSKGGKLKAENEKNLSQFAAYWINATSLQNKLVKLDQNLWNFWAEKNWVDGDLWKLSIKAISNIQEKLNLPVTWVVNFLLITMLFPKTFKTFNKNKNWRTVEESIAYVRNLVLWKKDKAKKETIISRNALIADVNKPVISKKPAVSNETVEELNENIEWIDLKTISWNPTEKRNWVPLCSRTARKNLKSLWVKDPSWWDAEALIKSSDSPTYSLSNLEAELSEGLKSGKVVYDVLILTKNWHRGALVYWDDKQWHIADPYYNWTLEAPLKLSAYHAWKMDNVQFKLNDGYTARDLKPSNIMVASNDVARNNRG